METRITLIAGDKGGTGKSMLATNLAVMLAAKGKDVLLIDIDTTRRVASATKFAQRRSELKAVPSITCVSIRGKGVAAEIAKLAPRFHEVVIDSGGSDSIETRQAMLVSQLMLIPMQPSQVELDSVELMDEMLADARVLNPRLVPCVVINRASNNSTSTDAADVRTAIEPLQNLMVAQTVISDLVRFKRAMGVGLSVTEFRPADEKAIFEIAQLFNEVFP